MADPLICQEIICELPSDYIYNLDQLPPPEPTPAPVPPGPTDPLPFDYTACNGFALGGASLDCGGDTFDCYTVGVAGDLPAPVGYEQPTLIGGNGWTGGWLWSDNPFGQPFGDDFESYPQGTVTTNTLNGGTGFSLPWYTD